MKDSIAAALTIAFIFLCFLVVSLYARTVQLGKQVDDNTAQIEQLQIDIGNCDNKEDKELDRTIQKLVDEVNETKYRIGLATDLAEQNFIYKEEGI